MLGGQSAGRFGSGISDGDPLLENFEELDNVLVRGQLLERLDLTELVDLLDGRELALHAFDGDILASLHGLRLDDFREGAFAFLGYQFVGLFGKNILPLRFPPSLHCIRD